MSVLFALPIFREGSCRRRFSAAIRKKNRTEEFSPTRFIGTALPKISAFRTVSQEQKTQKGPAFRISSAPATRHCESGSSGMHAMIAKQTRMIRAESSSRRALSVALG
jgi:hypothetical protein